MHDTELIVLGLLIVIPALSLLARALGIPYPIVLVLGGLPLGFIPGMPDVELDPELVLVLFLPPLLYAAAFFANHRELWADARAISLSAFPLVLFTMCAVAVIARLLIDELPWAAAFALGAIVSPTDPVAATSIFRRLGAPRRLVSLIEGESLLNDSTALIGLRVAVAAAVGGGFSLLDASTSFVLAVIGGVAIGFAVAWPIAEIRRRIEDPPVEITLSLFTGYAAYIPAEAVGASGVLAAVTAGVYLGWKAPEVSSVMMRVQGYATWEFATYLVNAILFVLVGLQLPGILDDLEGISVAALVADAAAICAVVVAARIAWVFTTPYLVRAIDRRPSQRARRLGVAPRLVVAWSGMRGAVSLAAALSLPLQTDTGAPFPRRELLIFLAYAVVLFTIVAQGLTLPALLRTLRVRDDVGDQPEEVTARVRAAEAALERLDELAAEEWVSAEKVEKLRTMYEYQRRRFAARVDGWAENELDDRSLAYQRLVQQLIETQRAVVVGLRNRGEISNEVMHRIQRELDLEESRLEV